jgi:hypothetical protein
MDVSNYELRKQAFTSIRELLDLLWVLLALSLEGMQASRGITSTC